MSFLEHINRMNEDFREPKEQLKQLKELDLFVLDNSLRESTVGQLRGHTVENKWKIYNEVSQSHVNIPYDHCKVNKISTLEEYDMVFDWLRTST